jgi:CheY-like chemotaxis protein
LVAEDNEFVRAVVCNALKATGYSVIETADGTEALNRFRANAEDIHLLVLDIDLPGSSGLRCREEIRKTHPTIPILLITGSAAIGVEEAQDTHSQLLRKPFKMAEMSNTIQSLLSRREQNDAS